MIYDLNIVPGTGNPVKITDLQLIWEAIHNLSFPIGAGTRIAAGFQITSDGIGIGEGILIYENVPYFLPPGVALVGQYLYVSRNGTTPRVYEDGTSRDIYIEYIVNASDSALDSALGTLVGQATVENINLWKAPFIPNGYITGTQLASQTVTANNIAPNSIGNAAMQENSISTRCLINKNVTAPKIGFTYALDPIGAKFFAVSFTGTSITSQYNTTAFSTAQINPVSGATCEMACVLGGVLSGIPMNIYPATLNIQIFVAMAPYTITHLPTFASTRSNFAIGFNVSFFNACPVPSNIEGIITGIMLEA